MYLFLHCRAFEFGWTEARAFIHAKIGPPKGGRSADHSGKKKTLTYHHSKQKKTSEQLWHYKALCQNKNGVGLCSLQEMIDLKSAQWIFHKTNRQTDLDEPLTLKFQYASSGCTH